MILKKGIIFFKLFEFEAGTDFLGGGGCGGVSGRKIRPWFEDIKYAPFDEI